MARQWLKMVDCLTLDLREARLEMDCKDAVGDKAPHALLHHVKATHSGIINGNHRFYRPDKMQAATHTWTDSEFARPVLLRHDKNADPLGRVRSAKYVDESWQYRQDFDKIGDTLFYATDAKSKLNLYKSVDYVVEHLIGKKGYQGLGYIDLGLHITNPDAIRKVLSEEYLTVSAGFKTDSAICSICHTDWAVDAKCEHESGDSVDGKDVFLILGNFVYQELSFVNFPADPFATKISTETLKDNLNKMFFLGLTVEKQDAIIADSGVAISDHFYETDIDFACEDSMETAIDFKANHQAILEEIKSDSLTQERAVEIKTALSEWAPEDEQKSIKRSLHATLNNRFRKESWNTKVSAIDPEALDAIDETLAAETAEPTAEVVVEDCGCGCGENKTECADWDNYTYASDEEREFFADEEGLYEEMALELESQDAKLSSTARKDLGKGTFCGPGRSFPVPDCAHVTAARRLIGRAKASEDTKAKIQSCVSRKAKSLGCGGEEKKDTVEIPADMLVDFQAENPLYFTDKDASSYPGECFKHYDALDKVYKASHPMSQDALMHMHGAIGDYWGLHSKVERAKSNLTGVANDLVNKGHEAANSPGIAKTDEEFSDAMKPVMEAAKVEASGVGVRAIAAINELHQIYADGNDDLRGYLSAALFAITAHWDSVRWLEHAVEKLSHEDKIIVPASEVTDFQDTINTLTEDRDDLAKNVLTLNDKVKAIFADSKASLARQLVMIRCYNRAEGFVDLTADQIEEKVVELSKRNIVSLRDAVKDGMATTKWNSVQDSQNEVLETAEIDPKTTISGDAVTAETVDPEPAAESLEDNTDSLAVRFLSPRERKIYFAQRKS
jgi:hypothetical protein